MTPSRLSGGIATVLGVNLDGINLDSQGDTFAIPSLGGEDVTVPGVLWIDSKSTIEATPLWLGGRDLTVQSDIWMESTSPAKASPSRLDEGGVIILS